MNCCDSKGHNTNHTDHSQDGGQTKIPSMSFSRWIIGFVAALSLIYLFTKVL